MNFFLEKFDMYLDLKTFPNFYITFCTLSLLFLLNFHFSIKSLRESMLSEDLMHIIEWVNDN